MEGVYKRVNCGRGESRNRLEKMKAISLSLLMKRLNLSDSFRKCKISKNRNLINGISGLRKTKKKFNNSYLEGSKREVDRKTLKSSQSQRHPSSFRRSMIHMSDLPEDLIEEILSRVPVASLKRLRTTCKRWNALLKDQGFTEKHFRKAPKQSQVLFGFLGRLKICSLSVNGCPSIEVIDEIRLTDPVYIYKQFVISEVFHCDGLLLCTNQKKTGLVVCNPCTRQSRWIKPSNRHKMTDTYTLGSYQDIKSNNISYKILRCDIYEDKARFEIYEFGCNSWRILDFTNDYNLARYSDAVSWRGKTNWVSWDKKERSMVIVSFDYTQERFGVSMRLPYYRSGISTISLSVVGEEKLSVLLLPSDTKRREIWVTNKIDEWNKVFTKDKRKGDWLVDGVSFLFDDEKKVFLCCERLFIPDMAGVLGEEDEKLKESGRVYAVGEDKEVKQVNGEAIDDFYDYVPSLVQIPKLSQKRKRGD
ncbi:hypothetical protein Bca4012_016175 [Brassica carinata]